jgi:hypothetical protein
MSRTLIINNTPYEIPDAGDPPGWGGDTTDWMSAVTDVLDSIVGSADILPTSFTVANNQTTPSDVTGLIFDGGAVRSSIINYNIYRISDSNPSGFSESGTLTVLYDSNASNPWTMTQCNVNGYSGVNLDITNSGQILYTSNDIGSVNYSGLMTFYAKSILQ